MSKQACGLCGKDPAEGFAALDGVRYCHEGPDPTCYMTAQFRAIDYGNLDPAGVTAVVAPWLISRGVSPGE